MTNSKFSNSPQFLGLIIVLSFFVTMRIFLIGSLYLIAIGQMAAPHIIQFVKNQLGSPKIISNTVDLQSAFGEIALHSPDTILATEMVLGALKTPKRKSSKSNKIVESGKIESRPRKYLTAKEKIAEQNWIDRTQTTDWDDRDCWLA